MKSTLIKNSNIVNEGKIFKGSVFIEGEFISEIMENDGSQLSRRPDKIIDAEDLYLFPGAIDDQVHLREPGLTHKADIESESKAAVAGGVTSYMEMPNTIPNALTHTLLEEKYKRAAEISAANYSFFMGTSNENIDEVLKTDPKTVCGVKVFMGSSTGNMLVDDRAVLEKIFSQCKSLIATHCEDESTIRENLEKYKKKYGDNIPVSAHPLIRSAEACYKSSSLAVELAKKYGTRLHVLHISTAKELELFDNNKALKDKHITTEACIHHLWFCDEDYAAKGNLIKWNPAIKTKADRDAILKGVIENKIDVVCTDHAPHTLQEKDQNYSKAPSGGPLIQHSLVAMLQLFHQKKITLEKIVDKMSHGPADCFRISKRGYIRKGYHADLVLVDLNSPWRVEKKNILYKCGWSPFEGQEFRSMIIDTFVNGEHVFNKGQFFLQRKGQRMLFDR